MEAYSSCRTWQRRTKMSFSTDGKDINNSKLWSKPSITVVFKEKLGEIMKGKRVRSVRLLIHSTSSFFLNNRIPSITHILLLFNDWKQCEIRSGAQANDSMVCIFSECGIWGWFYFLSLRTVLHSFHLTIVIWTINHFNMKDSHSISSQSIQLFELWLLWK